MTDIDRTQSIERRSEQEKVDVDYPILGPFMDTSIPSVTLSPGALGYIAGVDPRFKGCMVKFPGMLKVDSLSGVTSITQFQPVVFTNSVTDELVWAILYCKGDGKLYIDIDGTSTEVYSSGIDSTSKLDAATCRDMLYVTCEGQEPKSIYYDTDGTTLKVMTMGPGDNFGSSEILTAPSSTMAQGTEDTHYMQPSSTYQVAYRFYDSRRDIYSALSTAATVETGTTTDAVYKVTCTLPDAVQALNPENSYDTIEWFRTVPIVSSGAIFYQELSTTLDADGSYVLGVILDDALLLRDTYDPITDTVKPIPQGSTVCIYQGYTFVNHPRTDEGGYNISHSDVTKESPEYFTIYNEREGCPSEGRPLRFIVAGDYMMVLCENAILHVAKVGSNQTIQYRPMHHNRGLAARKGAHAAGNSIFMITHLGLVIVDSNTGDMNQVTATDGIFLDRWANDIDVLEMGYDTCMNATFIFNPTLQEALMIGHTVQAPIMLENMPYAHMGSSIDNVDGTSKRVYFISSDGNIYTPDSAFEGYGNMEGLDGATYDLIGDCDINGTDLIVRNSASINTGTDWVGRRIYITKGDNLGTWREIDEVVEESGNQIIRCTQSFNTNEYDVTYAISPVIFKARFWSLASHAQRYMAKSSFERYKLVSIGVKAVNITYPTGSIVPTWILGAYRNGAETPVSINNTVSLDDNPADSVAHIDLDGIDIEPYICQIGSNIKFKLIALNNNVIMTNSKNINN